MPCKINTGFKIEFDYVNFQLEKHQKTIATVDNDLYKLMLKEIIQYLTSTSQ